jgi:hypothetical protein
MIEAEASAVSTSSGSSTDEALKVMREALENQKLCDPSLDIDETLTFAVVHPDVCVVDSFASVEILSSLDGVFGTPLPKQILNHKSLTTLSGLKKSLEIIRALKK